MNNDFDFNDVFQGFTSPEETVKGLKLGDRVPVYGFVSTGIPKLDEGIIKCVELNKQIQANIGK